MSDASPRMCLCCKEMFIPNKHAPWAEYCNQPICRKAGKKASQEKWLRQPENRDYFRDHCHTERVQEWRRRHPGYWKRTKRRKQGPLQDSVALQDLVRSPTGVAFMGFLATLESDALQETVVQSFWRMHDRGQSILGMMSEIGIKGSEHACV